MTAERPLTPLMKQVLVGVARRENDSRGGGLHFGASANAVARECDGLTEVRRLGNGAVKGSWSGTMADCQRVLGPLGALRKRGLIVVEHPPMSVAYSLYTLTRKGQQEVAKIMEDSGLRTDAKTADGGDIAVWVLNEGVEAENITPCPAADISFLPGDEVTFPEEHESYPGETGIVQAVGMGTGAYEGQIVYDVLVEGTSDAERVTESDLEAA